MPRRKRSRGEQIALWTTSIATVGSLLSAATVAIGGNVFKEPTPPPLAVTCLQLQQDYRKAMESSQSERELILPGADGQSLVLQDPQAVYCKITPQQLQTTVITLNPADPDNDGRQGG